MLSGKLKRGIAKKMKPKVEYGMEWNGHQLQDLLCDLAIFPEDTKVPRTTLNTMQHGVHSQECVDQMFPALADRSLVIVTLSQHAC